MKWKCWLQKQDEWNTLVPENSLSEFIHNLWLDIWATLVYTVIFPLKQSVPKGNSSCPLIDKTHLSLSWLLIQLVCVCVYVTCMCVCVCVLCQTHYLKNTYFPKISVIISNLDTCKKRVLYPQSILCFYMWTSDNLLAGSVGSLSWHIFS